MTLPLPLRNRLAELILDGLRASEARHALALVWRSCAEPARPVSPASLPPGFPLEFFELSGGTLALKGAYRRFREELCERAGRAWALLSERPLSPPEPALREALDEAADLFDAGLYFEVHELLEPYWMRAGGEARGILQGLIQASVGFHHLANGNLAGARSLLDEGSGRLLGRSLEGREVGAFAVAVRRVLEAPALTAEDFDWSGVPRFPRD